jgi:subtilase family serine protease
MKNLFVFALALILVSPTFGAGKTPPTTGNSAPLPDLQVIKLKATQLKGGKVRVTYTIKNTGRAKSAPSVSRVTISTEGIKAIQENTPGLKPGDNFTRTIEYVLAKSGKYQIKATADYLKQVPENNERNNENTIKFGISRTI